MKQKKKPKQEQKKHMTQQKKKYKNISENISPVAYNPEKQLLRFYNTQNMYDTWNHSKGQVMDTTLYNNNHNNKNNKMVIVSH